MRRLGFGAMRLTGRGVWGPPNDHTESIAVLRRAMGVGITLIKRAAIEALKPEAERNLKLVDEMVARCFASQDYIEGRTAFMEKRKPRFTGK